MNTKYLLGILPFFLCCFCESRKPVELLYGLNCTYWDAKIGFGKCLCSDGTLYDYVYNEKGEMVKADYGDVIIGQLHWQMKADSLLVFTGNTRMGAYLIKHLDNNSLVLTDSAQFSYGITELTYTKSKGRLASLRNLMQ